jgi:hypothetical protein
VDITLHQCCHKHYHAKYDHKHCHEDKLFIKIKDDFIKSKTTHIAFPVIKTVLFFSIQNIIIVEKITPYFQNQIPPLINLVGVNFINFTSQRIFYS